MGNQRFWEQDKWTWSIFWGLMLLEFIGVVVIVKIYIQPVYKEWLGSSLYGGMLVGPTIAILLLTALYLWGIKGKGGWGEAGVRAFQRSEWKRMVLWGIVLMVAGTILIFLTAQIGNDVDNAKTDSLKESMSGINIILALLSAAVLSPLYEEIFYRGFVYRFLRVRLGVGVGLVASALIFTAAHYPTTNAMPVNFVDGLVFAWLYEKSGSIWPGVIVHGVLNAISILAVVSF